MLALCEICFEGMGAVERGVRGVGDAFPWGAGHGTLRDTRK